MSWVSNGYGLITVEYKIEFYNLELFGGTPEKLHSLSSCSPIGINF